MDEVGLIEPCGNRYQYFNGFKRRVKTEEKYIGERQSILNKGSAGFSARFPPGFLCV